MSVSPEGPSGSATPDEPFLALSLGISLTVQDLQKSLDWYSETVGFTVDNRHERDGVLRAVSLRAGDVRILLGQDDGAKGWNRVKGEGCSFQFTTSQDIDRLASRIRAHGGTLETEPTDTPWGTRVFRLRDPDGFKLVITSAR